MQKILLIDDSIGFCKLIASHLQDTDIDLRVANSGEEGLLVLERFDPDLILLDSDMPGLCGLEVCGVIRSDPRYVDLPIIFLTAEGRKQHVIDAYEAGCWDYVNKPYDPHILNARINLMLKIQSLLKALETRVLTDSLTKLSNRIDFYDKTNEVIEKCRASRGKAAVAFFDLDRFKWVNDYYGHETGDYLLIHVANVLKKRIEDFVEKNRDKTVEDVHQSCVARMGGDEFLVMVSGIDELESVKGVVLEIVSELCKPIRLGGREIHYGASAGISLIDENTEDLDRVVFEADTAMFESKREGRGKVTVFDSSMCQDLVNMLELEKDLRDAIYTEQINPCYQPIVDLLTGEVVGIESLARWNHPSKGVIGPDMFIRVAEDASMIDQLTNVLVEKSCDFMYQWQKEDPRVEDLDLHLNVSKVHLLDSSFVDQITSIVEKSGLRPDKIVIEIAETMAVRDDGKLIEHLNALRSKGFKIALDDFGSEKTSLSMITQLPLDIVKIDPMFLKEIISDRKQLAVVQSIIELSHSLDIEVIGEGVELVDQMTQLQVLNCDAAQGFCFSKPLSTDGVKSYYYNHLSNKAA